MTGDPTLYTVKHPIAEQFGERHLTIQEQDLFHKALRRTAAEAAGRTATMTTPTPAPDDWLPTAASINALPKPLRKYIHDLETNCDPAGTIRSEVLLREHTVPALTARVAELERERDTLAIALLPLSEAVENVETGDLHLGSTSEGLSGDAYITRAKAALTALKDTTP